ncbi:hypothetical protein MCOR25_000824 [Pyricularia grisea]|nr:hypothetical protein MCOR25_000824 [Pyricularia grisea]
MDSATGIRNITGIEGGADRAKKKRSSKCRTIRATSRPVCSPSRTARASERKAVKRKAAKRKVGKRRETSTTTATTILINDTRRKCTGPSYDLCHSAGPNTASPSSEFNPNRKPHLPRPELGRIKPLGFITQPPSLPALQPGGEIKICLRTCCGSSDAGSGGAAVCDALPG